MKKPITVGIDFDGVLAYNPFRIVRAPVTLVKRKLLGSRETKFYIPQTDPERLIWALLHESSVFPAKGTGLLRTLVAQKKIQAHLVTARYGFLQRNLYVWLRKHDMEDLFSTITINKHDEQPHLYKTRVARAKRFDYFIEDNLDIVAHMHPRVGKTKVLWIYNIIDRFHPYPHKFPYLERALTWMIPRTP